VLGQRIISTSSDIIKYGKEDDKAIKQFIRENVGTVGIHLALVP
jgi:hypothetical protein